MSRRCPDCADGWIPTPAHNGWPTIRPCARCMPDAHATWASGAWDRPRTPAPPAQTQIIPTDRAHAGPTAPPPGDPT